MYVMSKCQHYERGVCKSYECLDWSSQSLYYSVLHTHTRMVGGKILTIEKKNKSYKEYIWSPKWIWKWNDAVKGIIPD